MKAQIRIHVINGPELVGEVWEISPEDLEAYKEKLSDKISQLETLSLPLKDGSWACMGEGVIQNAVFHIKEVEG